MIRNSALSSITGKLGLAAYADTSTSDEETMDNIDNNNDNVSRMNANDNGTDSEEELKTIIKSKHRSWAKISDDIEEHLASLAEREEQQLKYYAKLEQRQDDDEPTTSGGSSTVGKSYERDFGETTETKLQHSNGNKRQKVYERKERTSRFSDNKDTNSVSTSVTYIAQNISQQQQSIPISGSSLLQSTQSSENYNDINTKRTNATIVQSSTKPVNSSKIGKPKCSTSLESVRQGKQFNDREKKRRRHHTSKHKHSTSDRSSHKSQKNASSASTTASSSSVSSTSTSPSSSNETDNSTSSNSHISSVRHKKSKRQRITNRQRSDKDRHCRDNYSRDYQHSSEHSRKSTSDRREKYERNNSDLSKHGHRRHNIVRRHRRRSSESENSRSRSRSRSSYASSSRYYRR